MEEAVPDELLMARYADGDGRAFDELFRRYEPRAYSYFVKRTGSPERAEDLRGCCGICASRGGGCRASGSRA